MRLEAVSIEVRSGGSRTLALLRVVVYVYISSRDETAMDNNSMNRRRTLE